MVWQLQWFRYLVWPTCNFDNLLIHFAACEDVCHCCVCQIVLSFVWMLRCLYWEGFCNAPLGPRSVSFPAASEEHGVKTHTMLVQWASTCQEVARVELHCGTDSWHDHTRLLKTTVCCLIALTSDKSFATLAWPEKQNNNRKENVRKWCE